MKELNGKWGMLGMGGGSVTLREHWTWRFLFAFSFTKWLMPSTISFDGVEVRIQRYAWLGLSTTDERIKLERVASVRIANSIITSTVMVETMGGAVSDLKMRYLPKEEARSFVAMVNAAL